LKTAVFIPSPVQEPDQVNSDIYQRGLCSQVDLISDDCYAWWKQDKNKTNTQKANRDRIYFVHQYLLVIYGAQQIDACPASRFWV
jgi:hypothetical protein